MAGERRKPRPLDVLAMGELLRRWPIYRGLFPIAEAFADALTWGA
jgi:hypothetical protein